MNDWPRIAKSFGELSKRHPFLEDHGRLMRILVNSLSSDPRFDPVEASLQLSTLQLRVQGNVHWVAVATRGTRYTVAIVDALESAEKDVTQCNQDRVVNVILEYLERLKR